MSASVDDGARFVRQRLLTEVGDAGQEHLRATPVQLLGGSHAARMHAREYLARAGVRVVRDDEPRDAGRDAPAVGRDAPVGTSPRVLVTRATVAAVTQRVVDPPDHPRSLQPAADLLMGALAAVEAVKGVLALGQPAALPLTCSCLETTDVRFRRMESIIEAVGQTPMVRLHAIERDVPGVELYLKLEYMNPGGSVKDRPARQMLLDAIESGRFTRDKTLIDATSGNTGVAYSLFGAALGYKIALVMPANVSKPRKDITQAYGTELIFSDPMEGSDGAIRLVRKLVAENPDKYFYSDQYSNPSNPRAHYLGTGVEILEQVGDRITHFVAALGTSGTAMGTTRRLREHHRKIVCVAAEPKEALHGLEGLKHMASSIVPNIYDPTLPDEILPVSTDAGWDMSDRLAEQEGLMVGHSSGANVAAALALAKRLTAKGEEGCIVTIACDRHDRYFAPLKWEKKYVW